MVRVFHVYFPGRTIALALTEALVIVAALLLAVYAEFGSDARLALSYQHMVLRVIVAATFGMVFMHYHDMYQSVVLQNLGAVLTGLLQVLGVVCVVCGILYYTFPLSSLGYKVLVTWVLLSGLGLSTWRIMFFLLNRSHRLRDRVVFVGDSPIREALLNEIDARPELGFDAVKRGNETSAGEMSEWIEREKITRVVVGDGRAVEQFGRNVIVQHAEQLYEEVFDKLPLTGNALQVRDLPRSMVIYKEITSRLFALLGLVAAAPVMAMVAIAVRLDSEGPALFRQKRVGKNGAVFTLYKFRSMKNDASQHGFNQPAVKGDSRFTRVGRLLRKTRLDELPQLWNILRGDMYLIGPRPFTVEMEEELSRKIPHYSDRWLVKPGVTGWAQVRRPYCGTLEDNTDKLAHDLFYIKNLSVGLDLLICFETLKIVLLGRGAQ